MYTSEKNIPSQTQLKKSNAWTEILRAQKKYSPRHFLPIFDFRL